MKTLVGTGFLSAPAAAAMLSLAVMASGTLGESRTAFAQSYYDYPWCSITSGEGHNTCYYNSRQECESTLSGVGGLCYRNQEYRGGSAATQAAPAPRARRTTSNSGR